VALGICEVGGGLRDQKLKNPAASEDPVAVHDESGHPSHERVQDVGIWHMALYRIYGPIYNIWPCI
jgi:hypothetical protein